MLNVLVFGKKMCSACNDTKEEFNGLKEDNNYKEKVNITFLDMDTIDGLTEGALNDVSTVPTTIFKKEGQILAKWEGIVPPKEEYQKYL